MRHWRATQQLKYWKVLIRNSTLGIFRLFNPAFRLSFPHTVIPQPAEISPRSIRVFCFNPASLARFVPSRNPSPVRILILVVVPFWRMRIDPTVLDTDFNAFLHLSNKKEKATHLGRGINFGSRPHISPWFKSYTNKTDNLPQWDSGGVLPYMAYTGMCCWTGYRFWPLCPKQGIWFRASLS